MKGRVSTIVIVIFGCLCISQVASQGSQWTEKEAEAVKYKLLVIFTKGSVIRKEYRNLNPNHGGYHPKTNPNAPKMLRLGFHDCLKYQNDPHDGHINGCDGCLNPTGMGIDMIKEFGADKNTFNGPDLVKTNNNGLMFTADILEEIYTNPSFPKGTPVIDPSLQESGKSRES